MLLAAAILLVAGCAGEGATVSAIPGARLPPVHRRQLRPRPPKSLSPACTPKAPSPSFGPPATMTMPTTSPMPMAPMSGS